MRSSRLRIVFALAALALLVAAAFLLRMQRALRQSTREVEEAHSLPFAFGPAALEPNPGFQPIASPALLRSGVMVGGVIYAAGPAVLVQFEDGAEKRTWHVGLDLPAAPIVQLAAGRLRGEQHEEILAATNGAGVLVLDPEDGSVRQLLPRSPGLRNVTAIATLPTGELLIGTERSGLLVYDGVTLRFYRPEYKEQAITCLLANDDGVWVGTQEDGIFHTHAGVTDHFASALPDAHIAALAEAGDRVFAATPMGVVEFDGGAVARTLAPGVFARALDANEGVLTVASIGEGTMEIPLAESRAAIHTVAAKENQVQDESFFASPDGSQLYAVRHDGIYVRQGASWPLVASVGDATLTDGKIAALGFDADGRLWIGYFDRGLDVMNASMTRARHMEDDHLFCINRIVDDPRRSMMVVATANGLVLFDRAGRPRQVLGRRDGLISENVTDVAFSGGGMTVATPAGLSFVSDSGIESLYAFQGLVNNHVYTLAVSRDGDEMLAGTLGGLSVLRQNAVVRNLSVANSGLRHNWITAIARVHDGDIVGTYGGGLMLLAADGSIAPMQGAPRDLIINDNAILATPEHAFAGSLARGLWMYSNSNGRWSQIAGGLPSMDVTALAEQDGMLYVGTQNGMVRIAESRLGQ